MKKVKENTGKIWKFMNGVFCPNEMSEKFEIEFFQSTSTEKEKIKEREKKKKRGKTSRTLFFHFENS